MSYQAQESRHKVFISYYHHDDQGYRDNLERRFGHLFVAKSVQPGDIETDLSDEYIKRLIQEGYISDSSVVVVLLGSKTKCRKHVDWEISAGLSRKVGGHSGLLGIMLPDFPRPEPGRFRYNDLPARLADNRRAEYAEVYGWEWATSSETNLRDVVQKAFDARIAKADRIDNSRRQMTKDTCG